MEKEITYDFSNPNLWIKDFIPSIKNRKRFNLFYGSRNSAKSRHIAQMLVMESYAMPTRCLVVRKTYASLKESVFDSIKNIVSEWGLQNDFIFTISPLHIRHVNGNEFIFRGLDKADKAKSINNPNVCFFEELDQIEYADFKETIKSIRGKKPIRIYMAMNPPNPDHWAIKRFMPNYKDFEKEDGSHTYVESPHPNTLLMHSNYKMNRYAKANEVFMDDIAYDKENDWESYRVSGLGLVGNIQTGLEYFDDFDRKIHITNPVFNPEYSIHVTFDFNNLPYGTCLVLQTYYEDDVLIVELIDEICPKPPRNSIEDIGEEFATIYDGIREFYYYGDPSGNAINQRKKRSDVVSYIQQIEESFANFIYNDSKRVIKSAPPLAGRRKAWKRILRGDRGVVFRVHESCKLTIGDLERLVINDSGGWLKKKVKDKKTGQSYEERGHCVDALTYFFAKLEVTKDLFYNKR